MFIIEVIPLRHINRTISQILTYYYKTPLKKGVIVEVPLKTTKTLGIVINSYPVEKIKTELKTIPYAIKKLNKVILETPVVNDSFWEISKFISNYYFLDLSSTIWGLIINKLNSLINHLENKRSASNIIKLSIINNKTLLFNQNLYDNIIDCFNSHKSVLLAFPNNTDLQFYLNHFKDIFDQSSFAILDNTPNNKTIRNIYCDLLAKKPMIIFGLKKTLGFPLDNLGLIIIFNSNDDSYKDYKNHSCINYENILKWFAKKYNIPIQFQKNPIEISMLNKLKQTPTVICTNQAPTNPKINIIVNSGQHNKDSLGYSVREDFYKLINKNKKWIFFLNKKGYWNGIRCRDCGYVFSCPNCNKALSYFKTDKVQYLQCNLCNHKYNAFSACPQCKSHHFEPTNIGLDKLEQDLNNIIKEKDIPLFHINSDIENQILIDSINNFNNSKNGVMIGTSVIFRPQITNTDNAAILNIDNLFSIPDYRIEEKILVLIWKLKSITNNALYIKTSYKNNPLFKLFANNDFDDFWSLELKLRKKYSLPPFSQIVQIEYKHRNQLTAKNTTKSYFDKIQKTIVKNNLTDKFILTPINPAFNEKINNQYYWNFKIKMKLDEPFSIKPQDIKMRNQLLKLLPNDFYIDVDPINNL